MQIVLSANKFSLQKRIQYISNFLIKSIFESKEFFHEIKF